MHDLVQGFLIKTVLYTCRSRTDGPDGWQPPAGSGTNAGAIVGATLAALLLLALLLAVGVLALWKYRIEPACAVEGQVRVTSRGPRRLVLQR